MKCNLIYKSNLKSSHNHIKKKTTEINFNNICNQIYLEYYFNM